MENPVPEMCPQIGDLLEAAPGRAADRWRLADFQRKFLLFRPFWGLAGASKTGDTVVSAAVLALFSGGHAWVALSAQNRSKRRFRALAAGGILAGNTGGILAFAGHKKAPLGRAALARARRWAGRRLARR